MVLSKYRSSIQRKSSLKRRPLMLSNRVLTSNNAVVGEGQAPPGKWAQCLGPVRGCRVGGDLEVRIGRRFDWDLELSVFSSGIRGRARAFDGTTGLGAGVGKGVMRVGSRQAAVAESKILTDVVRQG